VFTTALANYITANGPTSAPLGAVYGYNVAFTVSAVLLGASTVAALAFIRNNQTPRSAAKPDSVDERDLVGAGV
jgi:hypothetical protein